MLTVLVLYNTVCLISKLVSFGINYMFLCILDATNTESLGVKILKYFGKSVIPLKMSAQHVVVICLIVHTTTAFSVKPYDN